MNKCRSRGFTLIELLIFIVVVSVGLASVLSVIDTVVKSSADPMLKKQSTAIAGTLLEEILAKAWSDPSGGTNGTSTCSLAAGSNRSIWTNVCDYNGYTSNGVYDSSGVPSSTLYQYRVSPSVSVSSVVINGSTLKKVVVSVTDPLGGVTQLTGYRGDY
jgi:MSHA pilin protein MshD